MCSDEFTFYLFRTTSTVAYQDISDCDQFFTLLINIRTVFKVGAYNMPNIKRFNNKLQGDRT